MAQDVAGAIMDQLPTSTVWLTVYRDYNHEEGFCVRKGANGFFFRHFGGDRHNVDTKICDAKELYCATVEETANQLWALVNTLARPRGLELVYIPITKSARNVTTSTEKWRVGSASVDKEPFMNQTMPLLETLEVMRMHSPAP